MSAKRHLIYIPSVLKTVREQMTPSDFISTESIRKYVEGRMLRITSNIKVKIVYDTMNYTDGREIHINPFWAAEFAKSNFDALLTVISFAFHETLHVVHTDFEVCSKYYNGQINGKKISYSSAKYYLYRKHLSDIMEDAASEDWGKREYPGTLRKSIEYADVVFYKNRPGLQEIADDGARPIDVLFNAILIYAVLNIVPEFPHQMPEIEEYFNKCKELLIRAKRAQKTADRCKIADGVFEIIRPVIDDCVENDGRCPVFDPIQPSTHNRFDKEKQVYESFRKLKLDKYDLKVDIEWLTEEAAKDEYDRKIDRHYSDQLVMSISNLEDAGLGPLHNTIEIEFLPADIERFASYREKYLRRVFRLTPKIKILLKGLLAVIQREQDDTLRNLYAGNRYTEPFRADKKCCAYRKALSDEADLFIYVMVDSSGSMGKVSEYVKDALTMFYEVCRKMNVPVTIVSHMANGNVVSIRTLVDANLRNGDNVGIESYEAKGGTRDGVALSCAAEYLKFRKESHKLVIAISDGEPWHTCELEMTSELYHIAKGIGIKPSDAPEFFSEYSNYSASDIKSVIRSRSVYPIGIALAPTIEMANLLNTNLRALYPESFATDIDHLANKLSRVLEKYLYD